jgi:hypothetical protein
LRSVLRTLATVSASTVIVNYPWEMLQSPLFTTDPSSAPMWRHCFVASLGDAVLVLVLLGVGWALRRRLDWFERPLVKDSVALIGAGALLGIGVEWLAVHVFGRWSYRPEMPRIPGLEIGLVPVVQMTLLPPLVFRLAAAWLRRARALSDARTKGVKQ